MDDLSAVAAVRQPGRWPAGIPWKAIRIAAFYTGLLGAWELAYLAGAWPPDVFPSPQGVFGTLRSSVQDGTLFEATQLTLRRMAVGYSLSIVIGLSVGVAMGSMKWLDESMGTLVVGLQSLPSVTWFPLAALWFGPNEKAIVFVVLMGSVNSIAISARSGVASIPRSQTRASRMLGAGRWQMYAYVVLPGMLPFLVQGLKLGWSFAWRSLLAAELLVASASLGYLLKTGRDHDDVSLIVAVMVVIVVIGMVVDRLVFGRMEAWVNERWGLAG